MVDITCIARTVGISVGIGIGLSGLHKAKADGQVQRHIICEHPVPTHVCTTIDVFIRLGIVVFKSAGHDTRLLQTFRAVFAYQIGVDSDSGLAIEGRFTIAVAP